MAHAERAAPLLRTGASAGAGALELTLQFSARSLLLSRELAVIDTRPIEGVPVRVTTPARTMADCFKCRNKIGLDVALEALRDYRRARRSIDDLIRAYVSAPGILIVASSPARAISLVRRHHRLVPDGVELNEAEAVSERVGHEHHPAPAVGLELRLGERAGLQGAG